jgi:hypothetical protein
VTVPLVKTEGERWLLTVVADKKATTLPPLLVTLTRTPRQVGLWHAVTGALLSVSAPLADPIVALWRAGDFLLVHTRDAGQGNDTPAWKARHTCYAFELATLLEWPRAVCGGRVLLRSQRLRAHSNQVSSTFHYRNEPVDLHEVYTQDIGLDAWVDQVLRRRWQANLLRRLLDALARTRDPVWRRVTVDFEAGCDPARIRDGLGAVVAATEAPHRTYVALSAPECALANAWECLERNLGDAALDVGRLPDVLLEAVYPAELRYNAPKSRTEFACVLEHRWRLRCLLTQTLPPPNNERFDPAATLVITLGEVGGS